MIKLLTILATIMTLAACSTTQHERKVASENNDNLSSHIVKELTEELCTSHTACNSLAERSVSKCGEPTNYGAVVTINSLISLLDSKRGSLNPNDPERLRLDQFRAELEENVVNPIAPQLRSGHESRKPSNESLQKACLYLKNR